MSSLPADIWRLILDHVAEWSPNGEFSAMRGGMAVLTTCLALNSCHEIGDNAELASIVAERWVKAVEALLAGAKEAVAGAIEDHVCFDTCDNCLNLETAGLEEIVEHDFHGWSGRFYWRIGMNHPEVVTCEYDVKDIRKNIVARCEEELRLTDTTFQDKLNCATEVIKLHYPFNPAKIPHRLKSHWGYASGTRERVLHCRYPECPLCTGPLPRLSFPTPSPVATLSSSNAQLL